jgi:hypothetical protein
LEKKNKIKIVADELCPESIRNKKQQVDINLRKSNNFIKVNQSERIILQSVNRIVMSFFGANEINGAHGEREREREIEFVTALTENNSRGASNCRCGSSGVCVDFYWRRHGNLRFYSAGVVVVVVVVASSLSITHTHSKLFIYISVYTDA